MFKVLDFLVIVAEHALVPGFLLNKSLVNIHHGTFGPLNSGYMLGQTLRMFPVCCLCLQYASARLCLVDIFVTHIIC